MAKRDIADEIRGLDMAFLAGKIPYKQYNKTRNVLKLERIRMTVGNRMADRIFGKARRKK